MPHQFSERFSLYIDDHADAQKLTDERFKAWQEESKIKSSHKTLIECFGRSRGGLFMNKIELEELERLLQKSFFSQHFGKKREKGRDPKTTT